MKHTLKRLILIFVCVLTLGMAALAGVACNDTKSDVLTITVTDENGNAVGKDAVTLQVCVQEFSGEWCACYGTPKSTDENGKVTFTITELKDAFPENEYSTIYKIQINTAPAGYKSHATDASHIYATVDINKETSVTVKLIKE